MSGLFGSGSQFNELNGLQNGQLAGTGGNVTLEGKGNVPIDTFQAQGLGNTGNANGGLSLDNLTGAIHGAQDSATNTGNEQQQLIAALQQQQQGKGAATDLAAQQFQQQSQQAQQQAQATIAALRGINPAAAARLAATTGAANSQTAAGQAAQQRLQSQLGATSELAGVENSARSGDLTQLQLNQAAQNQQNALLNQQNLGLQGLQAGTAEANQNTLQNAQGLQQKTDQSNAQLQEQYFGALANAAGGALGLVKGGGPSSADAASSAIDNTQSSIDTAIGAFDGGEVDGDDGRRNYRGNDPRNDRFLYLLSKDEKVIPKTLADDGDATKAFVDALNASKDEEPESKQDLLKQLRTLDATIAGLRKKIGKAV